MDTARAVGCERAKPQPHLGASACACLRPRCCAARSTDRVAHTPRHNDVSCQRLTHRVLRATRLRGRCQNGRPASASGEFPGVCDLPPGRVLMLRPGPAKRLPAPDGKGSGKGGKGDGKPAADLPLPRKPKPSTAFRPIVSSGKGGKGRLGFFRACGRACAYINLNSPLPPLPIEKNTPQTHAQQGFEVARVEPFYPCRYPCHPCHFRDRHRADNAQADDVNALPIEALGLNHKSVYGC